MTRFAVLAVPAIIASSLSFAAPRPEASTYVDGNIASLKPNTGGTLVFKDRDAMLFKSGSGEVLVPYTGIQKAELGATQTHAQDAPLYKVWDLHKRLHKSETQLLTVEFKGNAGANNVMTFELPKPAAANVLAEIQDRTAQKASVKNSNEWWGDTWWKTSRNEQKWDNERASSHE